MRLCDVVRVLSHSILYDLWLKSILILERIVDLNKNLKQSYRYEQSLLELQSLTDLFACADGVSVAVMDFVVDENNKKTIASRYRQC